MRKNTIQTTGITRYCILSRSHPISCAKHRGWPLDLRLDRRTCLTTLLRIPTPEGPEGLLHLAGILKFRAARLKSVSNHTGKEHPRIHAADKAVSCAPLR